VLYSVLVFGFSRRLPSARSAPLAVLEGALTHNDLTITPGDHAFVPLQAGEPGLPTKMLYQLPRAPPMSQGESRLSSNSRPHDPTSGTAIVVSVNKLIPDPMLGVQKQLSLVFGRWPQPSTFHSNGFSLRWQPIRVLFYIVRSKARYVHDWRVLQCCDVPKLRFYPLVTFTVNRLTLTVETPAVGRPQHPTDEFREWLRRRA